MLCGICSAITACGAPAAVKNSEPDQNSGMSVTSEQITTPAEQDEPLEEQSVFFAEQDAPAADDAHAAEKPEKSTAATTEKNYGSH